MIGRSGGLRAPRRRLRRRGALRKTGQQGAARGALVPMRPEMLAALEAVAARFRAHGVPCVLGGSALLDALGLLDAPGDLDLLVPGDAHDAVRLAAGEWWRGSSREGTALWASAFRAALELEGGVAVDVIGGFAFREGSRVVALPMRSEGVVRAGAETVPLSPPALWWAVYARYRPERARLLERVVDPVARGAALAELGIGRPPPQGACV